MGVDFEIKRKITVDGKDYEKLDDIPPEVRTAIVKSFASGSTGAKTTIYVNGKTYSSIEDLPAPLRAIAGGMAALILKSNAGAESETGDAAPSDPDDRAVRPEPVLSMGKLVVAIVVAVLLIWIARRLF